MDPVSRRKALQLLAVAPAAASCTNRPVEPGHGAREETMSTPTPDPVLASEPLGFVWKTRDPFLFCVHHDDRYPAGNAQLGPAVSLEGRNLGQDFEPKDGFRMYHGQVVPGFPRHPHRGFETVTVVRTGLLDHADSMGAGARYGGGDVQWLTAGSGIQHAEMFPLLDAQGPNPLELFQIWLNLPSASKMAAPHFSMFWKEHIPQRSLRDAQGKVTTLTVIAGSYHDAAALPPPPNSWAAQTESGVRIWTVKMEAGASFTLPRSDPRVNRTLYLFAGGGLTSGARALPVGQQYALRPELDIPLLNGAVESELLVLEGRPIGEPVAQHGPFVMNTREELMQAYADYRQTEFGGWPFERDYPVHGTTQGRFARHADGRREEPA
jgi:redox-sensitive bicupin YhaK (pirin superfamily)